MPLTNKYLKYSPEITLEIFTLIWNKLIYSGINARQGNDSVKSEYAHFSDKFSVLRLDQTGLFGAYTRTHDYKETTVQEILGYNPFVKDDFVLPEKWFIRCTNESKRLLDKWTGFIFKYINIYYDDEDRKTHSDNIIPGYTEITFEQFQKYVLKTTEQSKVMEKDWGKATEEELLAEAKRRYPIGCTIKSAYDTSFNKTIDSDVFMIGFTEDVCYGSSSGVSIYSKEYNRWAEIISLPETKVESKEVIPEYVECIFGYEGQFTKGKIYKLTPTKSIYQYEVENCDNGLRNAWMKQHFKPSTKEAFAAQNKPKQPLKQAVHCKTQEEWNFVLSKFNPKDLSKNKFLDYKDNSIIVTVDFDSNVGRFGHLIHHKHQILSFQEWCDLNGYKMEKEVKFEVGDWVIITKSNQDWNSCMDCYAGKVVKITSISSSTSIEFEDRNHWSFLATNGHFRHATPEEINNYLISIGQITRGEPLNTGIEPNKDGNWTWESQLADNSLATKEKLEKAKMTLSIDDEELPMISIIKTNTIKQLLNIE